MTSSRLKGGWQSHLHRVQTPKLAQHRSPLLDPEFSQCFQRLQAATSDWVCQPSVYHGRSELPRLNCICSGTAHHQAQAWHQRLHINAWTYSSPAGLRSCYHMQFCNKCIS